MNVYKTKDLNMSLKIKVRESSYAGGKGFPKQEGTYIVTVKDRRPGLHKGPYSVKARWSNYAMDWVIEDQEEISQLGSDTEVLDYKPFNQKEYDSLREQEQIRDLGSVRRKEPFNIPVAKDTESKGESYYSQGNRDGRECLPMKTQESFHSRAAFLTYKTGYNDALDGIYEESFHSIKMKESFEGLNQLQELEKHLEHLNIPYTVKDAPQTDLNKISYTDESGNDAAVEYTKIVTMEGPEGADSDTVDVYYIPTNNSFVDAAFAVYPEDNSLYDMGAKDLLDRIGFIYWNMDNLSDRLGDVSTESTENV